MEAAPSDQVKRPLKLEFLDFQGTMIDTYDGNWHQSTDDDGREWNSNFVLGVKELTISLTQEAKKSESSIDARVTLYEAFWIMSFGQFVFLLSLCIVHVAFTLYFMKRVGLICPSAEQIEQANTIQTNIQEEHPADNADDATYKL